MATVFEDTAKNLCLSEKAKEAAWAALPGLRIGPDQMEVVQVVLHYALLESAERVTSNAAEVLANAKGTIASAAKETAGNMERAAARVEKASAAKLAVQQADLVSRVSSAIAESADAALSRKVKLHARNTFASWIAAAVVAAGLTCGAGFYLGKSSEAANAARVQTLFNREDGATWAALAEANNAANAISTYCRTGSENVHRVQGGTYCQVPLWLRHDGVVSSVPGAPGDPGSAGEVVSAYLMSWGPWWLLGAGTVLFVILRFLANLGGELEPLRQLLALPRKSRSTFNS